MNKFFKVLGVFCLILIVGVSFAACENITEIRAAAISEITAAGSDNFGIRVTFQEDKRLEKKGVDIQVKSSKAIDNVTIWHENQDKKSIAFAEKDKWYSLTTLLCNAENQLNHEQFEEFGKALTKTYLFNSGEKISLTFRVVVGDIQPNVQSSGYVLTGSVPVSNEFKLKIN